MATGGASAASMRPAATRSAGWIHASATETPPAVRIASRVPIAQRCSTSAIAAAESLGMVSSRDQNSSSSASCAALGLDARRAEADHRAHKGAGALGLAGGEIGMVQAPDDTVGALVNDQQVDEAHDVALAQALELGEHFAAEIGPVEADDKELDGSERHGRRLAR